VGEKHASVLKQAAEKVQQATVKLSNPASNSNPSSVQEEIDLLLKEQDDRIARLSVVDLPVRIPASRFKEFVKDVDAIAAKYLRPTPSKPYRATRIGTQFHSWVEDFLVAEIDQTSSTAVSELAEIFKNSRFANLKESEIELEINLTQGVNTFVCKLDAVFKVGTRYEIVDWKTGSPPESREQEQEMILQLALYRFAYSKLRNVPVDQIDVCFYFVADNTELRPEGVPEPAELMKLWEKLFA
jgi:DNA helicase-2/ATP-dependent DNA helicase PcrA